MVSFSCEVCNDTLVKKRLAGHFARCPQAYFTCIDCNKTFQGTEWQQHTSCITEDQKYQGKLYKPKTKAAEPAPKAEPKAEPKKEAKAESKKEKKTKEPKAASEKITIDSEKSLYKVIKGLKKQHKLDTKQLLKKITIANGTLELK